jgi:hypothetical protein
MSRRWVAVWVLAAAAVVLALLLTAVGQPVELMTPRPSRPAGATPPVPPQPSMTSATARAVGTGTGGSLGPFSPFIALLVQIVAVLAIVVVLCVLLALLRSVWRRPQFVSRPGAQFVAPEVPDELLAAARSQLALLAEGEPRNAIVAAWLSLETAAAATGLPREPAETSTEYTTRVLHTWDIDPRSLADLAALYREARFSRHTLTEEHRRRAMRDLTTLHDDLRRVASDAEGAATT